MRFVSSRRYRRWMKSFFGKKRMVCAGVGCFNRSASAVDLNVGGCKRGGDDECNNEPCVHERDNEPGAHDYERHELDYERHERG